MTYGTQGQPHQRVDQGYNPPVSPVAPTQAAGILKARQVIVSGTKDGVFVYSPSVGAGNLVESIAPAGGTDPYGNAYVAGFGSYNHTFGTTGELNAASLSMFAGVNETVSLAPAGLTIFNASGATIFAMDETRDAFFLYADTGSAVQGALIASQASAAGTDSFGNTFDAGVTAYVSISTAGSVGTWAVNLASINGGLPALTLQNLTHAFNSPPLVTAEGEGGVSGSQLALTSGLSTAIASAATVTLLDSIAAGLGTGILKSGVSIDITTAGQGLQVKEGSNAKQGTAILVGGTLVVANSSVTANSRIFLTCQVPGGTPGFLRVSARTAGTSFTILSSSNLDTSTVAYEIFEPG